MPLLKISHPELVEGSVRFAFFPRSQTPFGNALAEAIPLPIPTRQDPVESARNGISRRTGGIPKCNLGTREDGLVNRRSHLPPPPQTRIHASSSLKSPCAHPHGPPARKCPGQKPGRIGKQVRI